MDAFAASSSASDRAAPRSDGNRTAQATPHAVNSRRRVPEDRRDAAAHKGFGTRCATGWESRFVLEQFSPAEAFAMLRLALLFLIVALIAGLFGFNLVAGISWDAARIFFFLFIVLAVIFFIGGLLRGAPRDVV
jgi:uncharacterized membrane protein YtjA (UPF0391 family)